ncbi:hypothetical protein KIL84_013470 [Mauremys mutica]|uniref:Uncharacterized protein n=1 Tax=Mauremys mutica TaxID=74926 RepID=A0A9D3WXR4_9SAUR|nr:hypothetical protein KIL84_013470 [Mauremys mutica]
MDYNFSHMAFKIFANSGSLVVLSSLFSKSCWMKHAINTQTSGYMILFSVRFILRSSCFFGSFCVFNSFRDRWENISYKAKIQKYLSNEKDILEVFQLPLQFLIMFKENIL